LYGTAVRKCKTCNPPLIFDAKPLNTLKKFTYTHTQIYIYIYIITEYLAECLKVNKEIPKTPRFLILQSTVLNEKKTGGQLVTFTAFRRTQRSITTVIKIARHNSSSNTSFGTF
jgi:hypothetical protein